LIRGKVESFKGGERLTRERIRKKGKGKKKSRKINALGTQEKKGGGASGGRNEESPQIEPKKILGGRGVGGATPACIRAFWKGEKRKGNKRRKEGGELKVL